MIVLRELYFYLVYIEVDDRKVCHILVKMAITDLQFFFLNLRKIRQCRYRSIIMHVFVMTIFENCSNFCHSKFGWDYAGY